MSFQHGAFGTSPASWQRDAAFAALIASRPQHGDKSRTYRASRRFSAGGSSSDGIEEESETEPDSEGLQSAVSLAPSLSLAGGHAGFGSTIKSLPNEMTALLGTESAIGPLVGIPPDDQEELPSREIYKQELTTLLSYIFPIWATHILESSLSYAPVFSVGHLGTIPLASASLASMTINVVALSVIQGFVAALDTLATASWTSNPKKTSLYCLRTAVLLGLLFIPQALIFWNGRPILIALGQDPAVAAASGRYLKVASFGIPGYALFEVCRRWLQAQGLMTPPTAAVFIAAPTNILLNYLLVWHPTIGIGFIGAPLATAISMNLMGFLLLLYCIFLAPKDGWGGFSRLIFQDWHDNIRLGLAGTALVASEWYAWEIVGLAAAFLGPVSLASQSVLLTTSGMTYQAAFAASAAGSVRIGNLLGANRPTLAAKACRVAIALGTTIGVLNSALLFFGRKNWGKLFSNDPDVIELVSKILPLVALFQIFDSQAGANAGILRGANRAPTGAAINLISYYVIGVPIGLFITFWHVTNMGLQGIWTGLTIALFFTGISTTIYCLNIDFDKEAKAAQERAKLGHDYLTIH